ncbi:Predicted kinase [Chitinophaga sp. YR573]|uniref:AAA family ATPase n=1 Tax=Chitinophaga sp. YR573 TaxID=1881040 RepID=UPI0008C9399A|nr:AAA family ATPase [Chitinophaga sp. YR573]SEW37231.1 Predicted kinase [Chitinophaga sp. YR573]
MEVVIFCGIQATGKSTFFKEHFFSTHVRISMDLLTTRNREDLFMEACFKSWQKFVIDNTNPSKIERQKYISQAKEYKFKVIGYYFQSVITDALMRNNQRSGDALIPEIGIKGTFNRLQLPSKDEGFDELYYVSIGDNGFTVKEWNDEI